MLGQGVDLLVILPGLGEELDLRQRLRDVMRITDSICGRPHTDGVWSAHCREYATRKADFPSYMRVLARQMGANAARAALRGHTEVPMGEAAKLIFGYPVMIDGFALNSSDLPLPRLGLLEEVAKTVNALRYFNNDGMIFLWGETDSSGPSGANTALGARRAEAVAAYLRRAGVPAAAIQTLSLGSTFASRTSRRDAASRRVEIRFQEPPPPPAPTPQGAPTAVRPQLRLDLLPRSSVSGPTQFPPFSLTPTPNTGTQYGWPGLFKDENRQTWCQNIATLITISDGTGATGNALGALCSPIPVGGTREPYTVPLDQGTGLPNSTIFNLPTLHFNWP